MSISLDTILLYVNDPNAAAEFYRQLGFAISPQQSAMIHATLGTVAFTLLDQSNAEFQQDTPIEPKGAGVFFCIKTDDIDGLHASLVSKGLKPSSAPRDWPWGNREFAIKDPDGYKLVFYRPLQTKKRSSSLPTTKS